MICIIWWLNILNKITSLFIHLDPWNWDVFPIFEWVTLFMQNVEIFSTTSLTSLFQPGFPVKGVWLVYKASCFLYSSAPHLFIQSFQQLFFTDEEARVGEGRVSLRSVSKTTYLAIGDSVTSDSRVYVLNYHHMALMDNSS